MRQRRQIVSDMKAAVSDLFVQNNFRQGKAQMNAVGVQMYLEPYSGPFNTVEAAAVPDILFHKGLPAC